MSTELRRTPGRTLADFADKHGVTVSELTGRARAVEITRLRHMAMAQVKADHPNLTLRQIGHLFGGRDHKAVLHSLKQGSALLRGRPVSASHGAGMTKEDRLESSRRWRGATLRLSDITRIANKEQDWREHLMEASARHLEDLDTGGYPDASATELLIEPKRYLPIRLQVLWSSLADPVSA